MYYFICLACYVYDYKYVFVSVQFLINNSILLSYRFFLLGENLRHATLLCTSICIKEKIFFNNFTVAYRDLLINTPVTK